MATLSQCDRCKHQANGQDSGIPKIEICCIDPPFVVDLCHNCRRILRTILTEFMLSKD